MEFDKEKSLMQKCLTRYHDSAAQNQACSNLPNQEYIGSRVLNLEMCAGTLLGEHNNLFRASVSCCLFIVIAWMMLLYVVTDTLLQELEKNKF